MKSESSSAGPSGFAERIEYIYIYIYVYTYTYIHICMLHMPGNMYADVRHISQTGPPCGSDVGTWLCMAPCMKLMLCSSTRFLFELSCRGTTMFCSNPIHASTNCCCHHRAKHTSLLIPNTTNMLFPHSEHAACMMFGYLPHS